MALRNEVSHLHGSQLGLVQTVKRTAANVHDMVEADGLLHGDQIDVFGDADYHRARWSTDTKDGVTWQLARPAKRKLLEKSAKLGTVTDENECLEVSTLGRVEHPFRVIKRQFGFTKGAVPRAEEEHCADHHTVRAGQSLSSSSRTDWSGGSNSSRILAPGVRLLAGDSTFRACKC